MLVAVRQKVFGRPGVAAAIAGLALIGGAPGGIAYAQTPVPDTSPQPQTPAPENSPKAGCPEKQGARGSGSA